ncbi:hypothetical protein LSCM1_07073 [Leishmania martiniquensis]|uniref:Uncharacterized protein n=1 Tax=Leishmania martiniquensis TaxID=1580590 RepID=A0A836HYS9_9TRYP|nr:hypothetical protein LSCM1_07073 [Leishmania martiniquensis]
MSQSFLSSLALHISLHPSCRAVLRRHWPAPHYHKTPQTVFEEAEEQPRRQAAGASFAASLTAAVIGDHDGRRNVGGAREFNPYETFSMRLKRKRKAPVKSGCRSHGSRSTAQQQQLVQGTTTAEKSQSKGKRRMSSSSSSSPRVRSASSAARAGSSNSAMPSSSTVAAGASTATLRKRKSPTVAVASSSASVSSTAKAAAVASPSLSYPPIASSKQRTGGAAKTPSLPLSGAAAAVHSSRKTVAEHPVRKGLDATPTSVTNDSAAATPATPKRNWECGRSAHGGTNDTKKRVPRSTAIATRGSPSRGPAASKTHKVAGDSSGSMCDHAAGSDHGSERSYVRDPLRIRLPCNLPCRGRAGARNGHHPVHVSVRWSGARQRRRRFFAQYPSLASPESVMRLPQSSYLAALSRGPDGYEARAGAFTSEGEFCVGVRERGHGQGLAPPRAPGSVDGLDAADGASVLNSTPLRQEQQLGSSHREAGHTATATATTGRRDSLSSNGNRAIAYSHARMHGQTEDEDVVLSAAMNASSAPLARPFARHPARTSAFGISGSELPTPSSVEHCSAPPHSAVLRPNSLLIIRSPAQDYADESAAAGPAGAHIFRGSPGGVASASSLNQLRARYLTDTMFSSIQARSTPHPSLNISMDRVSSPHQPSSLAPANLSASPSTASVPPCVTHFPQQDGSLNGLARIQCSNALNMSGRNFSDPTVGGCVWSNSDSPTQVNNATLRSSGGDGGGAPTMALFSAVQSPLLSLSSTPLCLTPLSAHACGTAAATVGSGAAVAAPTLMMRSAHRSSAATSARGAPEIPPPLYVKTVMAQRRRSFLLRRQQQQQQHGCASSTPTDAFGAPPGHVGYCPSCDDFPPPHEQMQQSLVVSPWLPPLAPQPLDAAPGGGRLLGAQREASARCRASAGEDADDEPRSLGGVGCGGRDGTLYHHTSANAQQPSSHLPSANQAALGGLGEPLQLSQTRSDRPQRIDVVPVHRFNGESPPHLVAGEGGTSWSLASSLQLTQQYLPSSVQLLQGDGGTDLQEKPPGPWAYSQARLYAASESTAWLENNGLTTVTATPAMSPMVGYGTTSGGHCASYLGNGNNPIFSEPVTPLCWSQQRRFSGLGRAHQRASSVSLTSTSFLSHQLAPAPSPGTVGSALQQGVRRTPSGLVRAPSFTSTTTPAATPPQVFCKYQRSERQRRRRRFPQPLPGTRCPGMADRLAFDAYRAAMRNGAIAEEEGCSYYLSHHRCTSSSPMAAVPMSTSAHRKAAPQSSPSPPMSGSLLCAVSLGDCHIRSPPTATLPSAASHECNARVRWDDGQEGSEEAMAEREGTTVGVPSCLYHIPLCCDDMYHRDEEALEMLSITTTSSCAFGAGLDGLCWKEWMPSSPEETGEAMLRAAEQVAATAKRATVSSHVWASSRLSPIANNSWASQDAFGGALPAPLAAASVTTMGDSCATVSATLPAFGMPSSSIGTSSRHTAGVFASGGTVAPAGITAPRNSEDLACFSCRALDDAPACGTDEDSTALLAASPIHCSDGGDPQPQQRLTGQKLLPTSTSSDSGNNRNLSGSGKRSFIAEWIASKVQKHLEKKRQKKQRKQLEHEVAAVEAAATAGKGRAAPTVGNPRPPLPEGRSNPLASHAGGRQAQSCSSRMPEYSGACLPRDCRIGPSAKGSASCGPPSLSMAMPAAADSAQQQRHRQRIAYLAAAYQTELVIHEQKRREADANRHGLEELVHRSRAKMTPAAAAAGYYYEANVVTSPGISRPLAQAHHEPVGTSSLKYTRIDVAAVVAAAMDASGDDPSRSSLSAATYRSGLSSEPDKAESAAVEEDVAVSLRFPRAPARSRAARPRSPLTRPSKAGEELFTVPRRQQNGSAHARMKATARTTKATKLKPSDAAAPQERPQSERERRGSRALTVASIEERRRVALDTVKKKKQAIESWMVGVRS